MSPAMFSTVLVANRGEIAVRVIRTLRAMGIRAIAVYSDADAGARHVQEADIAVRLGPAPARESYLSIDSVIAACKATGAQAVHPGYGFLSENAAFAQACADNGITFIGPPAFAVEVMGDKIRAKQTVSAAGVPVVPGRNESGMTDEQIVAAADEIGFPVLVKPSAGGGGKGMHMVADRADLPAALVTARREAGSAFGDDTLFVERYITRPRHIEVQILADSHGATIHLGERECSLQRRHQKIVEEAPSPLLDEATRARIGAAAVETARSVGYTGAGTVEFIVDATAPGEFFFMEMNTRLQVEHPVTELVTGIDLVEQQVRIAAGRPLSVTQDAVQLTGHAVEARTYAEDPARGFLPTGGTVAYLHEPAGDGVRVDSGLQVGSEVGSTYDPMLSKVIAWGPTREVALARLDAALAEQVIAGVRTNTAFLRALLALPAVRAGDLDTGLVERSLDALSPIPVPVAALAAFVTFDLARARGDDVWDAPTAWRPTGPAPLTWLLAVGDTTRRVTLRGTDMSVDDSAPAPLTASVLDEQVTVTLGGITERFTCVRPSDAGSLRAGPLEQRTTWVCRDGATWVMTEQEPTTRARDAAAHDGEIRSPMPGSVVAVQIATGDAVTTGQALVVVEAMKMEHTLTAPHDGTADVRVHVGQQVAVDEILALVTTTEARP